MAYLKAYCEKYPTKRKTLLNRLSKEYEKNNLQYLINWFDTERKKVLEKSNCIMLHAFADDWYTDLGDWEIDYLKDVLVQYGYKVKQPVKGEDEDEE